MERFAGVVARFVGNTLTISCSEWDLLCVGSATAVILAALGVYLITKVIRAAR
jgi:hypothetical protein